MSDRTKACDFCSVRAGEPCRDERGRPLSTTHASRGMPMGGSRPTPAPPPTIIVSGFGRCGSSLTMQMLARAGVRCAGRAPAYEDDRTGPAWDAAVFDDYRGGAVKLLDPHRPWVDVPRGNYRCIWLDRDREEQAKSQAKLLETAMGLVVSKSDRNRLEGSLRIDRPKALGYLRRRGPILELSFERLLVQPHDCAAAIARHVGQALDVEAMASVRIARHPACLEGMALELSLIEQSSAGGGHV